MRNQKGGCVSRELRRASGGAGGARHVRSSTLRSAAIGAAALGLVFGALGAGAGAAGAAPQKHPARDKPVTKFAAYVGGHGKANAKLSPVTIGVVNERTATYSPVPTWTTGVKVAVTYINEHAGGIDGHPLKAVYCAIPTSVSSAASCGEEFADNSNIAAVAGGEIDVGNTALENALTSAKKPIFFGIALSTVDVKDPDAFVFYGDATHVEAPMATFAKTFLHVKSVSTTYPENEPSDVAANDIIVAALKVAGIKVYSAGFTSTDTNLTEPFEAAHVGQTTLVIPGSLPGPGCSDNYLTLKSLGVSEKVLVNVPCDTPTVAKGDGGSLPADWYYLTANPVPGSGTPAITSTEKVFTEEGKGPQGMNAFDSDAFGEVLTIAKFDTEILKAHKKITPAAVTAKAKAFKGPVAEGAPDLDCGGIASTAPALCNDHVRIYQNTAPTVMKKITTWIGPPKGFKF